MQFSYWEKEEILGTPDLVVVGSGIVGLSSAISFLEKHPKANVWVLERGVLPTGGSTKNAGFACFGSASELLDDKEKMSDDEVFSTVERRFNGLDILLGRLGKQKIDYLELGSHELFLPEDQELYQKCLDALPYLNKNLAPITGNSKTFEPTSDFSSFGFNGVDCAIKTYGEGQINTGKMMKHLLQYACEAGVKVFNGISVHTIEEKSFKNVLNTDFGVVETPCVIVATNGFSKKFFPELDVQPTRAQVLITTPIKNLKMSGIFHVDRGYYYFRNVGDRVLLGGGRQKDTQTEFTDEIALNQKIQNDLVQLLNKVILPQSEFEIEHQWAGIMGMGNEKSPIIKKISDGIVCGIRLGGMGVAMGSLIGKELVDLLDN